MKIINLPMAVFSIAAILSAMLGYYSGAGVESGREMFEFASENFFVVIVLVLGASTALYFGLIVIYESDLFKLRSEKSFYESDITNRNFDDELKILRQEISDKINLITENSAHVVLSEAELAKARETAVNKVISEITSETLNEMVLKAHVSAASDIEVKSLQRLSNVGEILGLRANKTLLTGVGFCLSGITFIFLSFTISPQVVLPEDNQWATLFINYLPRFTLVVIVEVIGFFFLKLYKSTLADIRYTQNEITNVEMRLIALHSANTIKEDYAEIILRPLIETERNSIIEKNQTTVEIEQQRAQSEADKSTIEAAVALLHGNEKGSIWRRTP